MGSEKECEDLFSGQLVETKKGIDVDDFNDFLSGIRLDIEQEIFKYLKDNKLVKEVDIEYM